MVEGSHRYDLMSSIPHANIIGKDSMRNVIVSLAKIMHQTSGYWQGRR